MEKPQVKVNNSNKCNPDKAIVKIDALLDEFVKSLHSESGAIFDKAQEEHEQSKESKEEQELTADEKGELFVWCTGMIMKLELCISSGLSGGSSLVETCLVKELSAVTNLERFPNKKLHEIIKLVCDLPSYLLMYKYAIKLECLFMFVLRNNRK